MPSARRSPRGRGRASPGAVRRLGDLDPRRAPSPPRDADLMHNSRCTTRRGTSCATPTTRRTSSTWCTFHPDDSVLEFGRHRRAEHADQQTLRGAAKARHYVFEPQRELAELIRRNGRLNECRFTVVHGALSRARTLRVPRFDPAGRKWLFARTSPTARGPSVPVVARLPFRPTAIVADCEAASSASCATSILERIRMVYFERRRREYARDPRPAPGAACARRWTPRTTSPRGGAPPSRPWRLDVNELDHFTCMYLKWLSFPPRDPGAFDRDGTELSSPSLLLTDICSVFSILVAVATPVPPAPVLVPGDGAILSRRGALPDRVLARSSRGAGIRRASPGRKKGVVDRLPCPTQ